MQPNHNRPAPARVNDWRTWITRAGLYALLWWILTGGEASSWPFGIPVILVATLVSLALAPDTHIKFRPISLIRFVGFFLWQAGRGGLDVSLRALHPRLPIHPGLLRYAFRLPPGTARVLLTNITGLLPGTMSTSLEEDQLIIHALDTRLGVLAGIRELEARLADLYGIRLPVEPAPGDER